MKSVSLIANVIGMATVLLAAIFLPAQSTASTPVRRHRVVVVSIPDRQLAVLENGASSEHSSFRLGRRIVPAPSANLRS